MNKNGKNISDKVMRKIRERNIQMRPRIYFIAGSLLLGIGLIMTLVLAIFFLNIVFYNLRHSASLFGFGQQGILPLLHIFPWPYLLISILGIIFGSILLKKYEISYRKSFFTIVIAMIGLIIALSFVLDEIGFGEHLKSRIGSSSRLYEERHMGDDWVTGYIVGISPGKISIVTPADKMVTVKYDKDTLFPNGTDFVLDEEIIAIGEWSKNNEFKATGIKYVQEYPPLLLPAPDAD